jgi:hypothetical protein
MAEQPLSHSWQYFEGLYDDKRSGLQKRIIEKLKDMQRYDWRQKILLEPLSPLTALTIVQDYCINRYARKMGFETLRDIKSQIKGQRAMEVRARVLYEEMQKGNK